MSVFNRAKNAKDQSKVHNSEYIRTENAPDEPVEKPVEPAKPAEQSTTE